MLDEFERDPGVADRLLALTGMTRTELDKAMDRIYVRIRKHMDIRPPEEHVRIFARERRSPYLFRRHVPFEAAFAIETAREVFPGPAPTK